MLVAREILGFTVQSPIEVDGLDYLTFLLKTTHAKILQGLMEARSEGSIVLFHLKFVNIVNSKKSTIRAPKDIIGLPRIREPESPIRKRMRKGSVIMELKVKLWVSPWERRLGWLCSRPSPDKRITSTKDLAS
jgi:hypothetical protein